MSRVIYYYDNKPKRRRRFLPYTAVVLLFAVVFGYAIFKGAGISQDTAQTERVPTTYSQQAEVLGDVNETVKPTITPAWPANMQSAIGAVDYGVINQSSANPQPVPMASLAKVMAAILIMEHDDITQDNEGDKIVFNVQDEGFYNKYLFEGGVVTSVKNGSFISQRDALKAMLIGSSNNLADTSVIKAFGSIDEYLRLANQKAQQLGMDRTTFADVTGFSPDTKATAGDLVLLAEYAIKNPLFAEIVSTWETTILDNIKITNTNAFLDFEGNNVIGIKTGLTDEAGGTYIGAASYLGGDGNNVIALVVTLGADNHFLAQQEAMPLLLSVKQALVP